MVPNTLGLVPQRDGKQVVVVGSQASVNKDDIMEIIPSHVLNGEPNLNLSSTSLPLNQVRRALLHPTMPPDKPNLAPGLHLDLSCEGRAYIRSLGNSKLIHQCSSSMEHVNTKGVEAMETSS